MPQLSVVVPVFNERGNIVPLLTEIAAALRSKVRRAISPVLCRGARGIPAPVN